MVWVAAVKVSGLPVGRREPRGFCRKFAGALVPSSGLPACVQEVTRRKWGRCIPALLKSLLSWPGI